MALVGAAGDQRRHGQARAQRAEVGHLDAQPAAGAHHPRQPGDRRREIRHVLEHMAHHRAVDAGRRDRGEVVDDRQALARARGVGVGRGIDAEPVGAAIAREREQLPAAAAEIEHAGPGDRAARRGDAIELGAGPRARGAVIDRLVGGVVARAVERRQRRVVGARRGQLEAAAAAPRHAAAASERATDGEHRRAQRREVRRAAHRARGHCDRRHGHFTEAGRASARITASWSSSNAGGLPTISSAPAARA